MSVSQLLILSAISSSVIGLILWMLIFFKTRSPKEEVPQELVEAEGSAEESKETEANDNSADEKNKPLDDEQAEKNKEKKPEEGEPEDEPAADEEAADPLQGKTILISLSNASIRKRAPEDPPPKVLADLDEKVIKSLIEMVSHFPPLPFNTTSIIAEMRGQNANAKKINELVSQDPILTAAILRVANSAYAAQETEVTSVQRSVLLMGYDAIMAIALKGAMGSISDKPSRSFDSNFDTTLLVNHNIATGLWAGAVARKTERVDPGEAVTCGLLHDLGKIALCSGRPDQFKLFLDPKTTQEGETMVLKEERLFGANHAIIGSLLAKEWKLPTTICQTIELHHHPALVTLENFSPKIRNLSTVVFIANQLSKLTGSAGNDIEIDLAKEGLLEEIHLNNDYDALINELLPEVERPLAMFANAQRKSA